MAPKEPQAAPKGAPVKSGKQPNVKWHSASKPNFTKLAEGEYVEGIFLGVVKTQYGPAYRFQAIENGDIFTLGGNRAQLDQVFMEIMGNPQGFNGDTIIGHKLAVMRESNVSSKQGRKVGVYKVGHVLDGCPKACQG